MFVLTHKQLLELKFWCQISESELQHEYDMREKYVEVFDLKHKLLAGKRVLEIGTGPLWGLLPVLNCAFKKGIDPLYEIYDAAGVLSPRGEIKYVSQAFENWETNEEYDVIITTNALDHGEMGFYLIVKMWRMLTSGGLLYIHTHLRPAEMLNLIHDHSLTEEELDKQLSYTNLIQKSRQIFEKDIDGNFCPALVGVWRKP